MHTGSLKNAYGYTLPPFCMITLSIIFTAYESSQPQHCELKLVLPLPLILVLIKQRPLRATHTICTKVTMLQNAGGNTPTPQEYDVGYNPGRVDKNYWQLYFTLGQARKDAYLMTLRTVFIVNISVNL